MLAFNIVESESFIRLIRTLRPNRSAMSRGTLVRRIHSSHSELVGKLLSVLESVPYVSTTADCWSAHHRAYLGMTVHWLDPATRSREHAVLTFSRLRGRHTYDVLARAMADVHARYNIQDKVTMTTTDNGSNFVKAFVEYGAESGVVPELPYAEADDGNNSDEEDREAEGGCDGENVQDISIEEIFPDLAADQFDEYDLPKHMRCTTHTLNLIATTDAGKAIKPQSNLKIVLRRAMGKSQSIWNMQGRSTVAADMIERELGRRLVVPNATRWNSTYDAVTVLNELLCGGKRAAVNKVMVQLKLQGFTDVDIAFLKEYGQVMAPVARALDIVQGEDQAYLGFTLPTLAVTMKNLEQTKTKCLQFCTPLVEAMCKGMKRRFERLFEDRDCQLAAAFHPKFRLTWLDQHNSTQVSSVKKAMEGEIETLLREQGENTNSISSASEREDEDADFFQGMTHIGKPDRGDGTRRSTKAKAKFIVEAWLKGAWKKEDGLTGPAFENEPALQQAFVKFNTGIPSSASVERMFSTGKDILRAKRATLSDENIERLVFLKGNRALAANL